MEASEILKLLKTKKVELSITHNNYIMDWLNGKDTFYRVEETKRQLEVVDQMIDEHQPFKENIPIGDMEIFRKK